MTGLPSVDLDPVRRLRVVHRAMEGTALRERVFEAPYDEVWSWLADLERSVPAFDRWVWRVRIVGRDGERLRARVPPSPFPFDVVLRDGWCWMASPLFVVGMAAVPEGPDRTRFAHLEGVPVAGPDWWRRMARPLTRRLVRGHARRVTGDLDGMAREIARRRPAAPPPALPAALPSAALDPIRRLRVLAETLDGVAFVEGVLDAPYEPAWRWLTDFEHTLHRFERDVWRARVRSRRYAGDRQRLRLRAWPAPFLFDVEVRDGWCWMHSPVYVVGMAAVPDGPGRTRYATLEGIPTPGPPWARRLLRPLAALSRRRHRRHLPRDLAGIARELRRDGLSGVPLREPAASGSPSGGP